MPPTLYRLSGLALMAAAVLQVVYWPLHPPGHDVPQQLDPAWAPAHLVGFASMLLLAFGYPAVYLRQANRVGRVGLIGAVVGYLQVLLLVDVLLFEALVVPVLAADPGTQALTAVGGALARGPLGAAHPAAMPLVVLTTSLGLILFGLATARAGVLPQGGGVLIALGSLLIVGGPVLIPLMIAGSILRVLGFGWIGWTLLRSPRSAVDSAAVRPVGAASSA